MATKTTITRTCDVCGEVKEQLHVITVRIFHKSGQTVPLMTECEVCDHCLGEEAMKSMMSGDWREGNTKTLSSAGIAWLRKMKIIK